MPFQAEIHIHEPETIREIIFDNINSLRRFYEDRNTKDEQLGEDLDSDAKTAIEVFKALFRDTEQFDSDESAVDSVRAILERDESEVLDQLCKLTADLARRYGVRNDVITKHATTALKIQWKAGTIYINSPARF